MDAAERFDRYLEQLSEGLGHADRHAGLRGYCTGLMLPLSRKSVEPINAFMLTGYAALQQIVTGNEPIRRANTSPDTSPSGTFRASDHLFFINCGNSQIFHRLMTQVMDLPEVAAKPEYATGEARVARREELFTLLQDAFSKKPWAYWQERMRRASVPCGQVRALGDALRSPEAKARNIVTRIPHGELGWVPNVNLPIRYSVTPLAVPKPSPKLGEHTRSVLKGWLGYEDSQIAGLAAAGAFGVQAAA